MARIFLSYAHEDQGVAKRIVAALAREGLPAWWDHDIPPGRTWDEMIGARIEAAHIVIVLWSKRSVASNFVKEEAQLALDANKLLPLKIEAVEPPIGFRRVHAANLSNWRGEPEHSQWRVVLGEIKNRLGHEAPAAPRVAWQWSDVRFVAIGLCLLALIGFGGFYAARASNDPPQWRPKAAATAPLKRAATPAPRLTAASTPSAPGERSPAPRPAEPQDVAQTVWQGPVFRASGRASEWAVRFNADGTAAIDFLDGRGFIDTGDWAWTQNGREVRLVHRPSGNTIQATMHEREMSGMLTTPNSPRDSGTFRFTRR